MNYFRVSQAIAFLALLCLMISPVNARAADDKLYDVVIYGGTSAGIAAAVQVKRMGGSVVVIEPSRRIGGLTTGGLGQTDIGNKAAIGGIAREFYQRVRKHYQQPESWKWQDQDAYLDSGQSRTGSNEDTMWTFEPSAALAIMQDFVREHEIPVVIEQRLDRTSDSDTSRRVRGVVLDGQRIVAIKTESGQTYRGRVFIDATYEGDLLAGAGVSYTVGREGNDVYTETLNGVQTRHAKHHQFVPGVDPYKVPGDASSGLLPGIDPTGPGKEGSGDRRVQGFGYRMCLTDHPQNRIPFAKPASYDPLVYELLLRNFEAGEKGMPWINSSMPNRKTDTNNRAAFSTDFVGQNYDYPEASHADRETIRQRHREYQQGLMWTLANHPRVPAAIRNQFARWGTCRDEFEREDGWQQQLYIREARRMIGSTVMTQHHCQGSEVAEDAIGLAAYTMDSHNVQRHVDANGHVKNEGDVQVGGFSPYAISYGCLTPKREHCENLLVPVCLSASHIAFGSIRMEPVFMVLGQSSATAAMQAIKTDVPVQAVDYDALKQKLLADGQVLAWTGPKRKTAASIDPKTLDGIVIDDEAAKRTGFDDTSQMIGPFVGVGYRHDNDTNKGHQNLRFPVTVKQAGMYEVRIAYSPNANRATNVPITIYAGSTTFSAKVNQRQRPEHGPFATVGKFAFPIGDAVVEIGNAQTNGHVIVDAIQLLPSKQR
ncbi:FAD-dependent oxidoreductase [Rubripirellula reticaptiva]|uniref:FAD dependent oxidoreductase n=1 Tax=Rubripirellula reticaptiva TaxID=2528013 RepID=A0A5C6F791_9BACT|nr:FAD-dependent oxidoreductase [Rubripirellula reticaptiva]TWU55361.1 FAD dependent oxidoreductase [Rubripirellula reticaptiva]